MGEKVSFEVDRNQMFDALQKLNGDFTPLGVRIVAAMLGDNSAINAIGMAVYGVTLSTNQENANG